MFSLFFVLFYFCVFVNGDFRQMTLPVYSPPTQEEIIGTYFRHSDESETNRTKKSILSVPDKYQQTVEAMKRELSANISKELETKNGTGTDDEMNISGPMQDYVRAGFFKNFLTAPIEPTTYRYPTAVWSSQNYEKLKTGQRFRQRNASRIFAPRPTINPAYVYLDRGYSFANPEKAQRRSRGKTKWKDAGRAVESVNPTALEHNSRVDKNEFVDRFLEQSLSKYLTSSNLRENVGNVSVKTFSDILRNITEQKPKRLQSPYDENKELRMKFREEVILKKKNETKPVGKFLEKQLQRRLEKVQDVFNERDKDKILANMWKYATLNRTTEIIDERKNKSSTISEDTSTSGITSTELPPTEYTTSQTYNTSIIYITTASPQAEYSLVTTASPRMEYSYVTTTSPRVEYNYITTTGPRGEYSHASEHRRGTVKFKGRYETTENIRESLYESSERRDEGGNNKNLLKLTAEESSYYRKGQFPSLTFIGQAEKPGVIPGRPLIDYPVHSFPPATKFRCPKFKGGKPRMMADPETRCQVFYICTGDGPTTAMLCPNGTMFNENFLVCDWWYNVKC